MFHSPICPIKIKPTENWRPVVKIDWNQPLVWPVFSEKYALFTGRSAVSFQELPIAINAITTQKHVKKRVKRNTIIVLPL